MDTTPNLPANVQLNVKPEVALAFGVGSVLGMAGMALFARHEYKKLTDLSIKQATRQHETQKYIMDKLTPHAPKEALADITAYLQTNLMASHEEGLELGMKPDEDDQS